MNISTYEVISLLSHEKPPGNQKIVIQLLLNDQCENWEKIITKNIKRLQSSRSISCPYGSRHWTVHTLSEALVTYWMNTMNGQ